MAINLDTTLDDSTSQEAIKDLSGGTNLDFPDISKIAELLSDLRMNPNEIADGTNVKYTGYNNIAASISTQLE